MARTTNIIIAIDGPAASGKSTVAALLAKKMGITYLNSGQMYRAITYKCLANKISFSDIDKIVEITKNTSFSISANMLLIDGKNYKKQVSLPEVENNVSIVAKIPEVRDILIKKQREIARNKSIIMDGRDIGTIVFPDATYKFYLDASIETRAERRCKELAQKFPDQLFSLKKIINEIKDRDNIDMQRNVSPLKQAKDAILVDTTRLSIEEMMIQLYNTIKLGKEKNHEHA
ncbi:MAG: (d)CMP kinase [Candidatus Margulisbacteria bacterium]|nr:(d)CMP kinase [Candidatus Margulisiibacteriota bacterium]